ncbi:MAG: hypothetical protein IJO20_03495 [Ruminococcus sp.]|nr:hypothetical protein [Ruminococcus sp.]
MNFLSPNIGFVRKIKVVYLGKFLCLLIQDILEQVCAFAFGLVCSVDVAVFEQKPLHASAVCDDEVGATNKTA